MTSAKIKKIIKQLYQIFEDFKYVGILKKNKSLKNLYEDQKCFILGTGASLNRIDIGKLNKEHSFGCNFLFKHKDFSQLNPSFFASIPPLWAMRRTLKTIHPKNYFPALEASCLNNNAKVFFHSSCKNFIKKNKFLIEKDVYYVKFAYLNDFISIQLNDLTKRITFKDGAFSFMIATSIYMGFSELYLCGCGYTYQPRHEFHFYDIPSFSREIPKSKRNKLIEELAAKYKDRSSGYTRITRLGNRAGDNAPYVQIELV